MLNLQKPSKKIMLLIACALGLIIIILINKFYLTELPVAKAEQFQNTKPVQVRVADQALLDEDEDGLAPHLGGQATLDAEQIGDGERAGVAARGEKHVERHGPAAE